MSNYLTSDDGEPLWHRMPDGTTHAEWRPTRECWMPRMRKYGNWHWWHQSKGWQVFKHSSMVKLSEVIPMPEKAVSSAPFLNDRQFELVKRHGWPDWSDMPNGTTHAFWDSGLNKWHPRRLAGGYVYFHHPTSGWRRTCVIGPGNPEKYLPRPSKKSVAAIFDPHAEAKAVAPEGATHYRHKRDNHSSTPFLFFKLDDEGVSHRWDKDSRVWRRFVNQTDSLKLIREALPLTDQPQPETPKKRRTGMNLRNCALLVRDDIKTVKVKFANAGRTYTYLLPPHIEAGDLTEGDALLVYRDTVADIAVAYFVRVDEHPDIDPNSDINYKWVMASLAAEHTRLAKLDELTDTIEQKLKIQQAGNVRDQILRQFGIESAAQLLEDKTNAGTA